MNWSFQLYSARNFTPWSAVLAMLAGLGYRQVEGFGGVYDDPVSLRAELDRNGLSMPSGHFAFETLEGDFEGVRRIADALGIGLIVCPYLDAQERPADAAGWRLLGERLAKLAAKADEAGYRFAWHNHDFELRPLADGVSPMDHLLSAAPAMGWEMDVAWLVRGGAEPLPWIDRHGDRIVAVHVKDIARPGQGPDEDGWCDIGDGSLDWRGLLKRLRDGTRAACFIVEHDDPRDVARFARRSIATLEALQDHAP